MNEKLKLALKIILFLAVAFIIGAILFFIFFQKEKPEVDEEEKVPEISGTLPQAPEGTSQPTVTTEEETRILPKAGTIRTTLPTDISSVARGSVTYVAPLIESPVGHLTLSADGKNNIFLNSEEGRFYMITPDGSFKLFSENYFRGATGVTFASDTKKAIIEYPDSSKILYNFTTDTQVTLPNHWDDFDFSPTSSEVAAKSMGLDVDNRWLITFRADGSGARYEEQIGENADKVVVDWSPNQQMIALYQKGIDFNRQDIFPVGRNEENFKATTIEGRGYIGKWSPSGERLFYSVYSTETNMNPTLWAVDLSGNRIGYNRIHIALTTWVDKCAFLDNERAYCGVPRTLPRGAGLVREVAKGLADDLYVVNYKTGAVSRIAELDGQYSVTSPTVTADGKYFLFIDERTSALKRIQLKQ